MSDPMTDELVLQFLAGLECTGEHAETRNSYVKSVRDHIATRLKAALKPVAEVTEGGYMERSIVWLEAAADLPAGVHKLYTATPALPEVSDEDARIACMANLHPLTEPSSTEIMHMLASLIAYRARLMAKAVPND